MPVRTIFVSGPPGAGKSVLTHILVQRVLTRAPHYIRLIAAEGDPPAPTDDVEARLKAEGVKSTQRVGYTPDRVFEKMPEALRNVRRLERFATAIIEGDADPCLRHAHPYDFRLFVMAAPGDVHEVFRTPAEARASLQQVMEDTAEFAKEIFGLFEDGAWDDDEGIRHEKRVRTSRQMEERLEVSEAQVRRFIGSPLGAEIASRIQLKPEFHGMAESDLVLVNIGVGACSSVVDECVRRLDALLGRIRTTAHRESMLYFCDPMNEDDPSRDRLIGRLRLLLAE